MPYGVADKKTDKGYPERAAIDKMQKGIHYPPARYSHAEGGVQRKVSVG
jgi:hypothetical protein